LERVAERMASAASTAGVRASLSAVLQQRWWWWMVVGGLVALFLETLVADLKLAGSRRAIATAPKEDLS